MWEAYEQRYVTKSLVKLPREIQLKYKAWIEIIKNGGPDNLKNYPGFKDEKLKGCLKDYRSSRLNIKYRLIYVEDKLLKSVTVMGITTHNYKEFL